MLQRFQINRYQSTHYKETKPWSKACGLLFAQESGEHIVHIKIFIFMHTRILHKHTHQFEQNRNIKDNKK